MNLDTHAYTNQHNGLTKNHTDPVCGMAVENEDDAPCSEYKGVLYFFCSRHCLEQFKDNPEEFLNNDAFPWHDIRQGKPLLGRPYTCPVHNGVIQDCPGKCYQCGAALQLVPPFSRHSH